MQTVNFFEEINIYNVQAQKLIAGLPESPWKSVVEKQFLSALGALTVNASRSLGAKLYPSRERFLSRSRDVLHECKFWAGLIAKLYPDDIQALMLSAKSSKLLASIKVLTHVK